MPMNGTYEERNVRPAVQSWRCPAGGGNCAQSCRL